jgi:hypothetical protein
MEFTTSLEEHQDKMQIKRHPLMAAIRLLVICMVVSTLLTATASSDPVYPPMVGGDFQFNVMNECPLMNPPTVPLTPPGRSVGIEPEMGGTHILCIDTPNCGEAYTGQMKITASGQRKSWKGRAFTELGGVGEISVALSDNTAYTYPGMKPKKATLVNE